MSDLLDLIVLGGGPAGMGAALVAGRARLNTLVLNAEAPRNRVTKASHGFLTRDGAHAFELLAVAKAQLEPYATVTYQIGKATAVERVEGGFEVTTGSQSWRTRRLIVATGYRDDLSKLQIPGIESVYGTSVFPCPFCDGFEHSDERLAVFMSAGAEHFVPVVRIWSRDIALFTHGEPLDPAALAKLTEGGIPVYQQRVARLHSDNGVLTSVELEDGTRVQRDSGFIGEDFSTPSTDFADQLGVRRGSNPWGGLQYETIEAGRTHIDGLYVIGDARVGFGGLMAAAFEGTECASHIVHEVATERWARVG